MLQSGLAPPCPAGTLLGWLRKKEEDRRRGYCPGELGAVRVEGRGLLLRMNRRQNPQDTEPPAPVRDASRMAHWRHGGQRERVECRGP